MKRPHFLSNRSIVGVVNFIDSNFILKDAMKSIDSSLRASIPKGATIRLPHKRLRLSSI